MLPLIKLGQEEFQINFFSYSLKRVFSCLVFLEVGFISPCRCAPPNAKRRAPVAQALGNGMWNPRAKLLIQLAPWILSGKVINRLWQACYFYGRGALENVRSLLALWVVSWTDHKSAGRTSCPLLVTVMKCFWIHVSTSSCYGCNDNWRWIRKRHIYNSRKTPLWSNWPERKQKNIFSDIISTAVQVTETRCPDQVWNTTTHLPSQPFPISHLIPQGNPPGHLSAPCLYLFSQFHLFLGRNVDPK